GDAATRNGRPPLCADRLCRPSARLQGDAGGGQGARRLDGGPARRSGDGGRREGGLPEGDQRQAVPVAARSGREAAGLPVAGRSVASHGLVRGETRLSSAPHIGGVTCSRPSAIRSATVSRSSP